MIAGILYVYQLDVSHVPWEFDVSIVQVNDVHDEYNAPMKSVGQFDDGTTNTRVSGHFDFLTSDAHLWHAYGLGIMNMWPKWKLDS